jgi:hypothetical protein
MTIPGTDGGLVVRVSGLKTFRIDFFFNNQGIAQAFCEAGIPWNGFSFFIGMFDSLTSFSPKGKRVICYAGVRATV